MFWKYPMTFDWIFHHPSQNNINNDKNDVVTITVKNNDNITVGKQVIHFDNSGRISEIDKLFFFNQMLFKKNYRGVTYKKLKPDIKHSIIQFSRNENEISSIISRDHIEYLDDERPCNSLEIKGDPYYHKSKYNFELFYRNKNRYPIRKIDITEFDDPDIDTIEECKENFRIYEDDGGRIKKIVHSIDIPDDEISKDGSVVIFTPTINIDNPIKTENYHEVISVISSIDNNIWSEDYTENISFFFEDIDHNWVLKYSIINHSLYFNDLTEIFVWKYHYNKYVLNKMILFDLQGTVIREYSIHYS